MHQGQHNCVLLLLPADRLAARRQECGGSTDRLKQIESEFDWIVREKDNLGHGE